MTQASFLSHSEENTEQLGEALGKRLTPGSVVLLQGDLGAGKTAFTRGVARALGADGVSSPTFALLNIYEGDLPIYHIDAYRLNDVIEAEDAGLDEWIYTRRGICLIEWPQRILDLLPKDAICVAISHAGADNRQIEIAAPQLDLSGLIATEPQNRTV